MREIVFDTETTGLNPENGDKVVEIGMVELIDLVPTGRTFHRYINPMRSMPMEAFRVHGLSEEFLSDFPNFGAPEIVDEMLEFIGDDILVAHNAEFDRKFINYELQTLGFKTIPQDRCVDTFLLARQTFPGSPASLDALCRRFSIDLKDREKHGALLDAKLLAAVYLELKGGREREFSFIDNNKANSHSGDNILRRQQEIRQRPIPLASRINAQELEAHQAFIAKMGDKAIWLKN